MALRPLLDPYGVRLAGVVLTPEEYQKHEAYHPFEMINEPTLFVSYDSEPAHGSACWSSVSCRRSNSLVIVEATDAERKALIDAGYRMIGLGTN